MTMLLYSLLLSAALALSAPWWLLRMATTERYREGLRQRLGHPPARLSESVRGRRVIWLHAVSVGEVLAASKLVPALESALGQNFRVVISTTTRTGQALARNRFGADRVFYMPLDFAFAIRAYLRTLKPAALVLMESELWPRLLQECQLNSIPVAVVNARMSDRSFARAVRMQWIWGRVVRMPKLWLAQSEQDALRLVSVGVCAASISVTGNLKYDVRSPESNPMARSIASLLGSTRLFVAGSTLEGEETAILSAWTAVHARSPQTVLLIAPRHPERFDSVAAQIQQRGSTLVRCSEISPRSEPISSGTILLLDTIGDLASVYALGALAFVGGSLVNRGGHNPLEPAQFAIPVVMGPSFENFRDIVERMQKAEGIRIVRGTELQTVLIELLEDREKATAMGERGRDIFVEQQGATDRSINALRSMIEGVHP